MTSSNNSNKKQSRMGNNVPEYWSMPPFFTIQPVAQTRATQMQMWTDLIAIWLKSKKKTTIYVNNDSAHFPFTNNQINRKLNIKDIKIVLDFMSDAKYGSWDDSEKNIFSVSWKSMNEWADMIYKWAVDSGQILRILTLFDIHSGAGTKHMSFNGLDAGLILKILDVLEEQGKCQVFKDGNVVDEYGVKFYEV